MTPPTDFNAVRAMRDELTKLLGGKAEVLAYMVKNKALHMKDQFRIFGAELARLGAGGTPAAAPSKPATPSPAPTPSKTHQFIPAKPATPPAAKPRAAGTKPDGAISLTEARERTATVFGYTPGFTPSQNQKSQWRDLEQVYRAAGFRAPWSDSFSKVDSSLAKLNSSLFSKRAAAIARLFPQS